MVQILTKEIPNFVDYFKTHSLEIVEQLIYYLWDDVRFEQMFNTYVEYQRDDHTINYQGFVDTLKYIQVSL